MSTTIVERIRKLLALAQDKGATDGEAATALSKARQLMLEHNVSEDALDAAGEPVAAWSAIHPGMTDRWQSLLGCAAAELMGVRLVTRPFDNSYRWAGSPEQLEAAELTYRYLVAEVEKRYKLALKALTAQGSLTPRIRGDLRKSFKNAAALTLMRRVEQIVAMQKGPSQQRALVVIDQKLAAADDLLKAAKVETRKLAVKSNGLGTRAGQIAGNDIKLQDTVR